MTRTNTQDEARRALRAAVKASQLLANAAELMRDASHLTETTGVGHADYLHWVRQIEELLSCDHGEAGIGPALQKIADVIARPQVPTYEHRRADGTIVRCTVPEKEAR